MKINIGDGRIDMYDRRIDGIVIKIEMYEEKRYMYDRRIDMDGID